MKKILFHFLALVLLWSAWTTAQAQSTPFTVLRNNTNIDTNYLYVEVMYERVPCDEHIAQFGFQDLNNPVQTDTTWAIRIDSILNNEGTYELNGDTTLLMRPKAGGYKLRFKRADFPGDAATSDSILICVKSSRVPYFCKGCAAAYSDALFAPEQDIMIGCPYDVTKGDLLACYKRTGKAGNWEAWIRDARDCKPYRIVQMPDNRWWFAQNLNYTKGITDGVVADSPKYDAGSNTHRVADGYYWCPGSANFDSIAQGKGNGTITGSGATSISGGDTACHTYGALYPYYTAIRQDGIFDLPTYAEVTKENASSLVRGVCPPGWLLPNVYDWGMMFNYVEGCNLVDITGGAKKNTCQYQDTLPVEGAKKIGNWYFPWFGRTLVSKLKTSISAPRDISHGSANSVDTLYATKTSPAWTWRTSDSNNPEYKKHNHGGNTHDKFGFSLLPSGSRTNNTFSGTGREVYMLAGKYYAGTSADFSDKATGKSYLTFVFAHDVASTAMITRSLHYGTFVRCISATAGRTFPPATPYEGN